MKKEAAQGMERFFLGKFCLSLSLSLYFLVKVWMVDCVTHSAISESLRVVML
jgi:hypothetical protein